MTPDARSFLLSVAVALFGYWGGTRAARYLQARVDVRDARVKLRKARKARSTLRLAALVGWLSLGLAGVVLLAVVLMAR